MNMLNIALVMALTFAVTACETIKGAGEDITNAGEAIERAVK